MKIPFTNYFAAHSGLSACRAIAILVAALLAPAAMAVPIVPLPISVAPGSTYRLLFVSNSTTSAVLTNISDYNVFATQQANIVPELAALGSNWVVVGGTSAVTALTNVGASTAPVYDLVGNLVGSSMTAICAATNISSHGPVNINQFGNTYSGNVWTGTADNCGTQNRPLGGNGAGDVRMGSTLESNSNWISSANSNRNNALPIYILSGEITAPVVVPEPGTVFLLGLGLTGALLARRRR